jgi:hypothetical protein
MRRNVATDAGLKSTVRDMTNSLEEMIKVKKYKREGDCPLIGGGRRLRRKEISLMHSPCFLPINVVGY